MTITSVSNASIQQILTSQLISEKTTLSQLSEQLASKQKYSDLTSYTPSDALNMINLQSSATQRQAYLGVISTVQARMSGYDTTMTDMESVISQAHTLASGNPNYNASTAASMSVLAGNFLKSISVDLNQEIGGRYIYSGSRYTTSPVTDLTTLTGTPTNAIYTDGSTLPAYDTASTASGLTMAISGQTVTIGGTVGTPQSASVTVGSTTYSYAIQASDTTSTIASGLASVLTTAGITSSASGSVLTVGGSTAPTAASANTTSTAAYATDTANIDSSYNLQYGVTSNNPAFQQVIAGLRFLQAAGNSTDAATYKTNITQATSLLTSGLSALQTVHAAMANNTNTLTAEKTTQNTAITDLTNQLSDIQSVDLTQVATEINLLQTQLQASYSATGTLEKMSIVQYL
jgi:flagellin-like hook-associated protein FlgL